MSGLAAVKPRANARKKRISRWPDHSPPAPKATTLIFSWGAQPPRSRLSRATSLCPAAPRRRREALAITRRRVAASASVAMLGVRVAASATASVTTRCGPRRRRSALAEALSIRFGGVGRRSQTARSLARLTALGLALLSSVRSGQSRLAPSPRRERDPYGQHRMAHRHRMANPRRRRRPTACSLPSRSPRCRIRALSTRHGSAERRQLRYPSRPGKGATRARKRARGRRERAWGLREWALASAVRGLRPLAL